ncbi:MAG: phenylacetate-CoA oxygenase/reductase subunit PaaK [Ottowia sp.]|nr:phenylacetate-CoA oxygenase/reductase subunit PaaK [Ottowia sp.]
MSLQFYELTVRAVQVDTDEAIIVTFEVPDALQKIFHFTQGQYLTLRHVINGQDARRSYSICAGIDETLRVGIRKVMGGQFSGWMHTHLKAGDKLQVMPPQGRFFVPIDRHAQRHYLGLAGGSGITPILSIIKTVLACEANSTFTLIYGNRSQKSTMFKEELEDLKNSYLHRLTMHYVFSDEHIDVPLHSGILNQEKIAEFFRYAVRAQDIDHAFVCGPYQMNDQAEAALQQVGIANERIHIERFGIPLPSHTSTQSPKHNKKDKTHARITIVRDGLRRDIDFTPQATSILDAAASAGLDVPYSCKSGVCCTCRAKLMEGHIRMERNFALDKKEVDAGYILTCQAHPLTDHVVISFDER